MFEPRKQVPIRFIGKLSENGDRIGSSQQPIELPVCFAQTSAQRERVVTHAGRDDEDAGDIQLLGMLSVLLPLDTRQASLQTGA